MFAVPHRGCNGHAPSSCRVGSTESRLQLTAQKVQRPLGGTLPDLIAIAPEAQPPRLATPLDVHGNPDCADRLLIGAASRTRDAGDREPNGRATDGACTG